MTDDYAYQLSIKFGDHDQYMVNTRAKNEEEFNARLAYLNQTAGNVVVAAETVSATAVEGQHVGAGVGAQPYPQPAPVPQPAPSGPGPVQTQPAPTQQQQQFRPTVPECAHGPMIYRNGQKNGKNWAGYMCPAPKEQPRCAPVWLDT